MPCTLFYRIGLFLFPIGCSIYTSEMLKETFIAKFICLKVEILCPLYSTFNDDIAECRDIRDLSGSFEKKNWDDRQLKKKSIRINSTPINLGQFVLGMYMMESHKYFHVDSKTISCTWCHWQVWNCGSKCFHFIKNMA